MPQTRRKRSKTKYVHLSISEEIYRKAKFDKCINLSAFLEKKLREELGMDFEVY